MIATDQVYHLPTSSIEPDPDQPRKEFPADYIESLGCSIEAEGLLQPITVRQHPAKRNCYQIIAGECRWRAHVLKNLPTVRSIISEDLEDEARRGRLQLIENMKRKNMKFREEAFGIERQAQLGDSDDQLASSLGMTKSRVQVLRQTTQLPESLWKLIDAGALAPVTVEAAVGKITFADVEGVLLRCAGKNVNQAAVILYDYQLQQRQQGFDLVLQESGVAEKKSGIVQALARQLMAVAVDVEKLSAADRTDFARLVGNDVAQLVSASKTNRAGSAFLSTVFTRVNTVLDPAQA